MKKSLLTLLLLISLSGCTFQKVTLTGVSHADSEDVTYFTSDGNGDSVTAVTSITEPSNTAEFTMTTTDGTVPTPVNNIYTITVGGTYVLSGLLNGGIIINTSGNVTLELNNVSIVNSSNSPIYAKAANSLKVKALNGTTNLLKDTRANKTSDDTTGNVGEGALSAKCDLSLVGQGTLLIVGNYNNGVHTTKDLSIKNQKLQVEAYDDGLKGKDSVSIESGTIKVITKNGDGIATDNSDLSSSLKQRGTIEITGGTIDIDSAYDGISAAYNFTLSEDSASTSLTIVSGLFSSNAKSKYTTTDSHKGIKSENEMTFKAGDVYIKSSDDAVHANYGTTLQNGSSGLGNITFAGGTYSLYAGDDAIHADNTLNINGGTVKVINAKEGLEANFVNINGGSTKISATDDGVNCSKKIGKTPEINVKGGLLDVTVGNGDTDGVDSNGNYYQSGGIVITRGPSSSNMNMSAIDADGTAQVTGGTLIALGALGTTPTLANTVFKATFGNASSNQGGFPGGPGGGRPLLDASSSLAVGNYLVDLDNNDIEFYLSTTQSALTIITNDMTKGNTYKVTKDGSTLYEWTQSSQTYTQS